MMIFLAPRLTMFAYSLVCGNEASRCSHNVFAFLLLSARFVFYASLFLQTLLYSEFVNVVDFEAMRRC